MMAIIKYEWDFSFVHDNLMDNTCPFIVILASLSFPLQMLVWASNISP